MASTIAAPAAAPVKKASSIWSDAWDLWALKPEPTEAAQAVPPLSNTPFRSPTDSVTNAVLGKPSNPTGTPPPTATAVQDDDEPINTTTKCTAVSEMYGITSTKDFSMSSDKLHFAHGGLWHPIPEHGDLAVVLNDSPNGLSDEEINAISTSWLPMNTRVGNMRVVHEGAERVWKML